ncbi:AAA family ATPase [Microcoleus sp. FACHB-672]|uniref:AAA family ATPase n=1 Tax=Microcoleus sp. FACHB-672 TaxID=2692825 RepID=UPI0016881654|nr:AAA family ATPase [Microcoleus sp. FACHB-672]MBD2043897.1 ATP-binding protein [Microcoleus sp. FACHB-672]
MSFNLAIPRSTGELLNLTINMGETLFVLGANGTGKSSIMQQLYNPHHANARRISAHRQTWFSSSEIDLSPQQKRSFESNIRSIDTTPESRWKDHYSEHRATIAIYDIIDAENVRARSIADAVRSDIKLAKTLSNKDTPIQIINEVLRLSNITITISIGENNQIVATKSGSSPYSIAELSDGERNALLIAANVLTVKSGTLVLIDEPERHLQRSIISPLLTLLLFKRDDCAFIVSTHDVMLPLDNPSSRTLLIRGCTYTGSSVSGWDADLVLPETEIDDDIKKDILGARRKILFIEGTERSLDKPLYSLVFPNVSIVAKSNCRDVEHTVSSIRDSANLHWVHAFGIVDNDRRPETDINRLKEKGIYALSVFSVESIYYHPHIQDLIAQRHASVIGGASSTYLDNAKTAAIQAINPHIQRLSEQTAEKAIREEFFRQLPKKTDISAGTPINVSINVPEYVTRERDRLENLLNDANLAVIISQYPVRETPALDKIAKELRFQNREQYEEAVRKLLLDNKEALTFVKSLFGTLASDIEAV